jgi:hypothetical protein
MTPVSLRQLKQLHVHISVSRHLLVSRLTTVPPPVSLSSPPALGLASVPSLVLFSLASVLSLVLLSLAS